MKTHQLAAVLSETLDKPVATVLDRVNSLQSAGMFSKGTRGRSGGLDLSERDVINLLLACELKPPRGTDVCDLISKVRCMFHDEPPGVWPFGFTQGLASFASVNAGDMLQNVIREMRTGAFDRWAGDEAYRFTVGLFHDGSSVFLSLERGEGRAVAGYAKPGWSKGRPSVERQTVLDDRWFRHLADQLGPLLTEK